MAALPLLIDFALSCYQALLTPRLKRQPQAPLQLDWMHPFSSRMPSMASGQGPETLKGLQGSGDAGGGRGGSGRREDQREEETAAAAAEALRAV